MTSNNKKLNNNNNNNNNNNIIPFECVNNNKNNNKIKILNHFIFKDVSKFLANKSTFNEILEYALLSKQSFEIFRNIISYNGNICSIVFPFPSLKQYAYNSFYNLKRNNTSTYKFKLIQNKETEYLSLSITNKQQLKQLNKTKSYLKLVFPKLKKVNIINKVKTNFHLSKYDDDDDDEEGPSYDEDHNGSFEFFDDTYNGFFTYERVSINWDIHRLPFSTKDEITKIESTLFQAMFYPFSFKGIEKLKPRKVYLNSYTKYSIHLYGVDSILNCSSTIRSIKFDNTPSTSSFIKKALSLPNIESLSLKLINQDDGKIDSDFVYNVFKDATLDENSTLKRLVFKSIYHEKENQNKDDDDDGDDSGRDPMSFFTLLKFNNSSLNTLGLEIFNIKNYKQLQPLSELVNIKTLYIHPNNIIQILLHCIDNQNIQQIKIQVDKFTKSLDLHGSEVMKGFFKMNNNLKKIVVKKSSPDKSDFLTLLKNIIKNSKTSCKLIIKKVYLNINN
ncbi:hypothetical protein ACTFIV_008190 [Dictyostelium citrinum]